MRDIIRCPSCFTYVYSDARRCHGCGERTGRRRLLTRGSWIFIVLAVTGFAVARGIDIHQEKRDRMRREFEGAARSELATKFVQAWIMADSRALSECIPDHEPFVAELGTLRDRFPGVLPATKVIGVKVKNDGDNWSSQRHVQINHGLIWHDKDPSRTDPSKKRLLASTPSTSATMNESGGRNPQRNWRTPYCDFQAEFTKNAMSYTVFGRVCFDDAKVCCLSINKIAGVEGTIAPKE